MDTEISPITPDILPISLPTPLPITPNLLKSLHSSSTPEFQQFLNLSHTYLTEYAKITPHVNLTPTDIDNLTDVLRHIICCMTPTTPTPTN